MNPDYHMSGIHYEFNDIPNMVRIAIHNESSGERDLRKLIEESLRNTDIKNYGVSIKWKASQVLFSRIVVKNVKEDQKAIEKGAKEMLKLIQKTSRYIDDTINEVLHSIS